MIEWVLIPADELDRRIEAAVARALAASHPVAAAAANDTDDLWTVGDIMRAFRLSDTCIHGKVISHPTFPAPEVSTGTVRQHRRWSKAKVLAWREAHPDLTPRPRRPQIRKQKS